ncbi:protein of unknown function DUF75 [Dehalogenimonas lykanthroporepellens BL-DC-9]|nr:protein of unknown function DUF75 [Dehalogenimonas lykanthroporepellens BL-DC-9]
MTGRLDYLATPNLERPLMVVGWKGEAGTVGERVTDYLAETLEMRDLADIDPVGYFSLSSVEVSDDLVSFPFSRFKYSEKSNLITFYSDTPAHDIPEFLSLVLELAARHSVCQIVTINALPVMASHNTPQPLIANLSTPLLKEWLSGDGINTDIDFESPPGPRPPLSSYLLWSARQKGIEAVSLWVPVPYYLASFSDEVGIRRALAFLREKLAVPLALEGALAAEQRLRETLGELRRDSADVDKALTMLESSLSLTEYEAGQLAAAVREKMGKAG